MGTIQYCISTDFKSLNINLQIECQWLKSQTDFIGTWQRDFKIYQQV